MENLETAAAEVGGLRLPDDIEPISVAGKGRRSVTFKASFRGQDVALKAYRQEAIESYRRKYDVNIAVFEMSRNRAFRKIPELTQYAAKPLSVFGQDGRHSLVFVQELIDGIPLPQLAEQNKGLPDSVLEAGETIVRMAELNELHDLDLFYKNVLVRKVKGVWQPALCDFNLMPQYKYPPNPILKLAYKTGARKPSHRDYRCLAEWRSYSEQCAKT